MTNHKIEFHQPLGLSSSPEDAEVTFSEAGAVGGEEWGAGGWGWGTLVGVTLRAPSSSGSEPVTPLAADISYKEIIKMCWMVWTCREDEQKKEYQEII